MADTSAQAEIRKIDIDKLAKGFADEELVLKRFVTVSPTSAREIRWYQKTAGFLDSTDTSDITTSQIANVAFKARPVVVEQSWTRKASYVRKYFVESPWISEEDIKDCDLDILATNVRDLVSAVSNQTEIRIYDSITGDASINTSASTQTGWDDTTSGNPILDIMTMKEGIRNYRYNPEGAILYIHTAEHKHLLNFLISVKGSSIPNFASQKVETGVVMELLGCKVVVSINATTDQALLFVPGRTATWKQFVPITSAIITDVGIGRKIRVWEEGECIVTDPRAAYKLTDTLT